MQYKALQGGCWAYCIRYITIIVLVITGLLFINSPVFATYYPVANYRYGSVGTCSNTFYYCRDLADTYTGNWYTGGQINIGIGGSNNLVNYYNRSIACYNTSSLTGYSILSAIARVNIGTIVNTIGFTNSTDKTLSIVKYTGGTGGDMHNNLWDLATLQSSAIASASAIALYYPINTNVINTTGNTCLGIMFERDRVRSNFNDTLTANTSFEVPITFQSLEIYSTAPSPTPSPSSTPTPTGTPAPPTPTVFIPGGYVEISTRSAIGISDSIHINYVFYVLMLFTGGYWLGQWLIRR